MPKPSKTAATRKRLEQLVGRTVSEISFTDPEEYTETKRIYLYLMFDDGSVFRVGPKGFELFSPGKYVGD